jgi:hypothetical protein
MTAGPPARPTVPLVSRVLPRAGGARGERLDGPLGRRPVARRGWRGPAAGRRTTRARALYRRWRWAGPAAHTAGGSGRARPAGSGALGAGRPAVRAVLVGRQPDWRALGRVSGGVVEQVAEDAADRQRVHPDQQRPGSLDDDRMVGVGQPGGLGRSSVRAATSTSDRRARPPRRGPGRRRGPCRAAAQAARLASGRSQPAPGAAGLIALGGGARGRPDGVRGRLVALPAGVGCRPPRPARPRGGGRGEAYRGVLLEGALRLGRGPSRGPRRRAVDALARLARAARPPVTRRGAWSVGAGSRS